MDFSCKTRALSSLMTDIKNGKFSFDSPLQREEEQWNSLMKSELIDSLITGYPIDPARASKETNGKKEIWEIFDGKQRITTIRNYINNDFALSKSLEPVSIDGVEYKIAGKRFKKLPEPVREKLLAYEIQIYVFSGCTDKDKRVMFKRQNQGKALSVKQLRTVLETPEEMDIIFSLSKHSVMNKLCTNAQHKNATDRDIIIQTLMLIESTDKQKWFSFRAKDINNFLIWYADNIHQDKIDTLKEAMEKLDNEFEEKELVIKPSTTPMLLAASYKVMKNKQSFNKFVNKIKDFIQGYDKNEKYKEFLISGTSAQNMVEGRWNYWKNIIKGI